MPDQPTIETQKQRWLKYGANAALSSILVVALAAVVVFLIQRSPRRIDTTSSGLYSLKPQTINIIRDNPKPVKIVSLQRLPQPPRDNATADERRGYEAEISEAKQRQQVLADLLNEYRLKGRNIEVSTIDPLKEPAKEDALIQEVEQKYGGELNAYKQFLDAYDGQHQQILALCSAEVQELKKLPPPPSDVGRDTRRTFGEIADTVEGFPALLDAFKANIDKERKRKIPNYQQSATLVKTGIEGLNERLTAILDRLARAKDDAKIPQYLRDYMSAGLPRYQKIKEVCDSVIKTIDGLGDLKLDTLRRSLQQRDPILIMGESDIRILPFDQIWKESPAGRSGPGAPAGATYKPRFAGEQLITTAILSINQPKKQRIAVIRPGGPPLTDPGFPPFQPAGPLSSIGDRLRQYNFDVVEKDASGQWAMQSQMRGGPSAAEPTDDDIKDAIWVVLAFPTGGMMGGPDPVAPMLKQHLAGGGSAFVIVAPRATGLDMALADWGIKPRVELVAVHEPIKDPGASAAGDEINDARRRQYVFDLRDYGDHALTRPLLSLESLMVPLIPIERAPMNDVISTPILPLGGDLKVWGESDFTALQSDQPVAMDEKSGDIPGPLNAGVVAERPGAGRVVVIGSPTFAFNFEMDVPDPELARQGIYVSRFPANGELFMNSIFWLAKMEPMIAISPSAMEVSRIRPMSPGALSAWRAVLVGVIPGTAVLAGILMYLRRRD